VEIVKILLAHNADPSPITELLQTEQPSRLKSQVELGLIPPIRYYLARAAKLKQNAIYMSLARTELSKLSRLPFHIVGQDFAIDDLCHAFGMHGGVIGTATVAILCGPSGTGKSYLARRLGKLLDLPTHVVNMSSLRSQAEFWQLPDTNGSAGDALTLEEFLSKNEGKSSVVGLEDIEMVEDRQVLQTLLVPWELGRCLLGNGHYTDTSKVIWLVTSTLGANIVLDLGRGKNVGPAEYRYLQTQVRNELSDKLGAPLVSRISVVLPFMNFSSEEKTVIAWGFATKMRRENRPEPSAEEIDKIISSSYTDVEGARSLSRAIASYYASPY